MDISVIITSYNSADTIAAAIDSALAQTERPTEVIVVDDGSQDASLEVIDSFAEQVKVVNVTHGGVSRARNAGLGVASGTWVAFLDGDDTWHPEKLAQQINAAAAHPHIRVIATDWARSPERMRVEAEPVTREIYASDIAILNRYQTSTVMARRDIVEQCGGFDPAMDTAEDWDMWLRLAKLTPSLLVQSPLVFYRDNPNGVSKDLRTLAARAADLMAREAKLGYFDLDFLATLAAWHQQRFVVASALDKDWANAARLMLRLPHGTTVKAQVRAATRYTLPFLSARLSRRYRRS